MTATLPPDAFPMLDAPEFATIATSNPNGYPQLSVVWVERDGNDLLVSTIKGRRKYLNMERDPRVTVLVYPKDNPYSYVEVRGTVTMVEEGGRELPHIRHRRPAGTGFLFFLSIFWTKWRGQPGRLKTSSSSSMPMGCTTPGKTNGATDAISLFALSIFSITVAALRRTTWHVFSTPSTAGSAPPGDPRADRRCPEG
jgi:PPOX class probable F420-dependent enzyme